MTAILLEPTPPSQNHRPVRERMLALGAEGLVTLAVLCALVVLVSLPLAVRFLQATAGRQISAIAPPAAKTIQSPVGGLNDTKPAHSPEEVSTGVAPPSSDTTSSTSLVSTTSTTANPMAEILKRQAEGLQSSQPAEVPSPAIDSAPPLPSPTGVEVSNVAIGVPSPQLGGDLIVPGDGAPLITTTTSWPSSTVSSKSTSSQSSSSSVGTTTTSELTFPDVIPSDPFKQVAYLDSLVSHGRWDMVKLLADSGQISIDNLMVQMLLNTGKVPQVLIDIQKYLDGSSATTTTTTSTTIGTSSTTVSTSVATSSTTASTIATSSTTTTSTTTSVSSSKSSSEATTTSSTIPNTVVASSSDSKPTTTLASVVESTLPTTTTTAFVWNGAISGG